MEKYACTMCGHIYDPATGETKAFSTILCNTDRMEEYECKVLAADPIPPGTDFTDIPANWRCPSCGYPKSYFRRIPVEPLREMRTITY